MAALLLADVLGKARPGLEAFLLDVLAGIARLGRLAGVPVLAAWIRLRDHVTLT
jgi:hypothetical protein